MNHALVSAAQPNRVPNTRLELIDALRGVSAFAVMLFHFSGHRIFSQLKLELPTWVFTVMRNGDLGVQVFFVISGFVIAYSTRRARVSGAFARSFLKRRAIRLAPPYWFAIVAAIAAMWLSQRFFDTPVELPSWPRVVAHLFYVQGWLGYEDIYPIFWTLCHEVQFYLLFLLALTIGQQAARNQAATEDSVETRMIAENEGGEETQPTGIGGISTSCFTLLFVVTGMLSATGAFRWPGACLDTWYLFSLGVIAYRCVAGLLPTWWFALIAVSMLLLDFAPAERIETHQKLAGIATASLFVFAGLQNRLTMFGEWTRLQWLGTVSYSLYLMHGIVGYPLLSVGHRLTGTSPWAAAGWLLLAIGLAIGVASIMYAQVERRCLVRR